MVEGGQQAPVDPKNQPNESYRIDDDDMDGAIDHDDKDDLTIEEGITSRDLQKRLNACLYRKERREKAWIKQNSLIN